uniref:RNA helicase n=1 Tax=Caenorhabditis japonica TaxID=281687 RepID=A0A8R1HJC1_CAEJA
MTLPWDEDGGGAPVRQEFAGLVVPPEYSRAMDFSKIDTKYLTSDTRKYLRTLPNIKGAQNDDEAFEEYDNFCEEKIRIQFSDEDKPSPGPDFGTHQDPQIALSDPRISNNLISLNVRKLNAVQRKAIPLIRSGYGLLLQAPTGIGKTYSFLIPAVERALEERAMNPKVTEKPSPSVLIMTSTGRLITQIYTRCCLMMGVVSDERVEQVNEIKLELMTSGCAVTSGQCDIAFATMGKLEAAIKDDQICLDNLKLMILDEADKMVDESAFGMLVDWVFEQVPEEVRKRLQCCFFSATYTEFHGCISLSSLQSKMFGDNKYAALICPRKPGYIDQRVIRIPRSGKNFKTHESLVKMAKVFSLIDQDLEKTGCSKQGPFKETILIFCETVQRVSQVTMALRLAGYNFKPLSRMISKVQQQVTLNDLAHAKINGVVASNLMARGIDIPSIRHTIVMEMSMEFNTYKHRIGRVGRDGSGGKSTVFVAEQNLFGREGNNIEALVEFLIENEQKLPKWLEEWYNDRLEQYARVD